MNVGAIQGGVPEMENNSKSSVDSKAPKHQSTKALHLLDFLTFWYFNWDLSAAAIFKKYSF